MAVPLTLRRSTDTETVETLYHHVAELHTLPATGSLTTMAML